MKFSNIKPDKNYKRLSIGHVFTGAQLRNLLALAGPEMQAVILLDVQETTEVETKSGGRYGI